MAANLSSNQKNTLYCEHLKQAQKAINMRECAEKKLVAIKDLEKILKNADDLKVLSAASSDGQIPVYVLPGNNMVVPSFSPPSHESPLELIHIRNMKCPLGSCREKRSKLHTLTKKEQPICLHTILCHSVEESSPKSSAVKTKVPKIDRDLSVSFVMNRIREQFPGMGSVQLDEFLKKSRKYLEKLVKNPSKSEIIAEMTPKECKFCQTPLLDWPFKAKQAFLLSMGHISEIEIVIRVCPKCKRVFYPGKY